MEWIKKFFKEEEGTEVVEWALVLGVIVLAAVAGILLLGPKVGAAWDAIGALVFPVAG